MKVFKRTLAFLCAAALTFSLASCGGSKTDTSTAPAPSGSASASASAAPAATGESVELSFWTWRVEDVEFYDSVIADFEAANPGITVVQNPIKSTDYNTTLAAALAGDGGPDVFMSRAYGGLQTFADSGYMLALDDLMPQLQEFEPDKLSGAISPSDGKIYGVPAVSQTMLCYYNTDMYKELGLEIPKTWDQFLANMQACKDAGYTGLANGTKDGWICEVMLGAAGASWYGGDAFFDKVVAGETTFEDPVFVNAVDRLNDLKAFMPDQFEGVPYTDMQTSFANGLSAHMMSGSFEAGTFATMNPDLQFDVFAVPGKTESDPALVSTYADMNYSINAASQKQEAALKFLEYLATPEFGKRVVDELKMITSVPGVDMSSNAFISRVKELQDQGSTPYLLLVGFRYEQPTGSSLFQASAQAMFTGDSTAEQVCKELQEGVATYYKPFQK